MRSCKADLGEGTWIDGTMEVGERVQVEGKVVRNDGRSN